MSINQSYDEKELLSRVSNGDELAFKDLLRHYQALCYGMALRILRDDWMAEDIVQDVFLKVWLRRTTLATVDNFGAWLRTVIANRLYDYLKKKKAEANRIESWWDEARLSAKENLSAGSEENQLQALVEEAIPSLTPRQQQAFRLVKQEGYSREEAARIIGVSPDTVKTHLDLAVRFVRAYCLQKLDPSVLGVLLYIMSKKYF